MVKRLSCSCANITVHLAENAVLQTENEVEWLTANSTIQKVGKGVLSLAGITTQIKDLVEGRDVLKEWTIWKCYKCLNCEIDVYSQENSKSSSVLVNLDLEKLQEPLEDLENLPDYSPVFRILLPVGEDCDIESPKIPRKSAGLATILDDLNTQIEAFKEKESLGVEERIKHYAQLQRQKFENQTKRAQQERNILFEKLKLAQKRVPAEKITFSSEIQKEKLKISTMSPVIESPAALIPKLQLQVPVESQSLRTSQSESVGNETNIQVSGEISGPELNFDEMFEEDQTEEQKKNEKGKEKLVDSDDEDIEKKDNNEKEDIKENSGEDKKSDIISRVHHNPFPGGVSLSKGIGMAGRGTQNGGFMFGTSLPVSIPMAHMKRPVETPTKKKQENEENNNKQNEESSDEEEKETGDDTEDKIEIEVVESIFDVPQSKSYMSYGRKNSMNIG